MDTENHSGINVPITIHEILEAHAKRFVFHNLWVDDCIQTKTYKGEGKNERENESIDRIYFFTISHIIQCAILFSQ